MRRLGPLQSVNDYRRNCVSDVLLSTCSKAEPQRDLNGSCWQGSSRLPEERRGHIANNVCQIGMIQNIKSIHDQFQLPEGVKLLGLLACRRFEAKAFRETNVQACKAWPLTGVPGHPGRALIGHSVSIVVGSGCNVERGARGKR